MDEESLVRNYAVESGVVRLPSSRIFFWDETLRDGEQMPGVFFTLNEKMEIAKLLDEVGVHIVDAGMPVISKMECEAVKALAREGLKAKVMGVARLIQKDVDACLDAEVDEISVVSVCSNLHLKYKLKKSKEEVLELAVKYVEYARDHGLFVNFVTEDTVRADLDFVRKLYNAAIDAGAGRAVLCDTVGVVTPAAMRWWIEEVKKGLKKVQLSIHCHNDFGMAVANELAALECGVEVPQTTVNGIGERAGNAPLEELVMALESIYDYRCGLKLEKLYELSRLVEELSGFPLSANKPVVGCNAFSHEAGIHVDGLLKHALTYEPMQPEMLGRKRKIVLGKHTGTASIRHRLDRAGIKLPEEKLLEITTKVKNLAETREKSAQVALVREVREYMERMGISDEEFWQVVKSAGIPMKRRNRKV
jgi:isopropylmalate/citramalate/homocitrate synthase-like protein